jgi:hypothetical protein
MLIDLSELPEGIRRHVEVLRACVENALRDFVKDHNLLRWRYSLRTEASIINDYMIDHAKRSQDFQWKIRRNLFLLEVSRDFRMKLKKINGRFRTSNIPTNLSLQFDYQRPMRLFDDLDLTHIVLGYQRDPVEISASRIWLVCPNGKQPKWIAEITGDRGSMQVAVSSPTPEAPPQRRVRPKRGPKRDDTGAVGNE